MDSVSIEDILRKEIESEPSPRKQRNLEIVLRVLTELHAENIADFSIARVGRRVEELGGPRTQSLRNGGGAHFRSIIERFANGVGSVSKKTPLRPMGQAYTAIEHLPDAGVKAVLKMTLEENRRLKSENDTLRNAYKDLSFDGTERATSEPSAAEAAAAASTFSKRVLSDVMLEAFQRFLSERWMGERAYVVQPDDSIVDDAADSLVARPGFVDGFRRVIENS